MSLYEARIALRYLRARRKTVVVSVVTSISVLGVVAGTAALVVALALLTGFQEDVRQRILAANAHLLVYGTYAGVPWHGWNEPLEWLREQPETSSATPLVLEKGLVVSEFNQATVVLRGIDPRGGTSALPGKIEGGTLEELEEKQNMAAAEGADADIFGCHAEPPLVAVNVFHLRNGRVVDRREFYWEDQSEFEAAEFFSALLKQY